MSRTREEMLAIVRRGESVLHGLGPHARIISREEDIPSDADLAVGDREKLQAAREALEHRRAQIEAEIAAVESEIASLGQASKTKATRKAKDEGATDQHPLAGPPESGEENQRSQATATVGTATSDADAAPQQATPPA